MHVLVPCDNINILKWGKGQGNEESKRSLSFHWIRLYTCIALSSLFRVFTLYSNILFLFWCSTEDPPLCSLPDSLWAIGSTFLFPCHPKWATANCQKSKLIFFFPCVTKKQNAKTQKAKKIKGLLNSESSEYSRATFCDLRLVTIPTADLPK